MVYYLTKKGREGDNDADRSIWTSFQTSRGLSVSNLNESFLDKLRLTNPDHPVFNWSSQMQEDLLGDRDRQQNTNKVRFA